ncbi:MAG: preprotein translocase subunit SecY [Candidatus Colwellbacteria bacterium]|nr:preprotein translocase subunit SecY [Candidatus Colwellbacteria bacterium]
MLNKIQQVFRVPEIRKKILIIMGLLIFFRLLSAIPLPGVDLAALRNLLQSNNLFGLLNIFSGGSLNNLSIALLSVGPYITATIILQLLTMIFPKLKEMYYEEGTAGRAKFNKLGRFLTVPLAAIQTYGLLSYLVAQRVIPAFGIFDISLWVNIMTAVAGSMIILWLGELIDEQKLGNGVSLVIFAGIVSGFPSYVGTTLFQLSQGAVRWDTIAVFLAFALLVIFAVVFVNQGEHRIPVSYPRRVKGNRVYGGVDSYLPIKVNQAGVIPIIFGIALLSLPQMVGQVLIGLWPGVGTTISESITRFLSNPVSYGAIYFFLVFAFTYLYTSVVFNPEEVSKNLQRSGGFIPGIRPGEPTSHFLSSITSKITLFGALFLGFIAILPMITQLITGKAFIIGGTSLLIVVSVALDSANQIDSQLKMREYDEV